MPKLPTVTGREAIRAFERAGFCLDRVKGSHHIMRKDGPTRILTIPVHGSDALRPGTLRALIRQSGITVEQFLRYLRGENP
jgi:predicted RNA binding protein YcfA (HicA-like mRNA interferase family)